MNVYHVAAGKPEGMTPNSAEEKSFEAADNLLKVP
jgi:hypothetical protein